MTARSFTYVKLTSVILYIQVRNYSAKDITLSLKTNTGEIATMNMVLNISASQCIEGNTAGQLKTVVEGRVMTYAGMVIWVLR